MINKHASTMSVSLDHQSYPHIIDSILHHCSLEALNVLRAAGRPLRDRISELFLQHVAIRSPSNALFKPTSGAGYPMPVPFLPSVVKTLDILNGDWRGHLPPPDVLDRYTSLTILRRCGAKPVQYELPSFGAPVHTVVDHISTRSFATRAAPLEVTAVPGARRHVLHVSWDEYANVRLFINIDCLLTLEQFYLVLWPYSTSPGSNKHITEAAEIWGTIRSLNRFIRGGGTLTIVGLEDVHPRQVSSSASSTASRLQNPQLLMGALGNNDFFSSWSYPSLDVLRAGIVCLTRQQWYDAMSDEDRHFVWREPGEAHHPNEGKTDGLECADAVQTSRDGGTQSAFQSNTSSRLPFCVTSVGECQLDR